MKKYQAPNELGLYGDHGGRYVAETLMYALKELENNYDNVKNDDAFWNDYNRLLEHYVGGPSPIYFAERLTEYLGGAKIYFKREDLNHTGSHKINNVLGQILLAIKMNKKKVIAETGAGQHGVATATVAAKFGLECRVYMGKKDIERQSPNVFRMKLLGAEVVSVASGGMTLKDAMNEAMRAWITNVDDTFYVLGTVAGPHPYPLMVRDFQSVIGNKTKEQMHSLIKRQPDILVACVGGGSNAIGLFYPYIDDENVRLVGVEAGGLGLSGNMHAAPISSNSKSGVLHGFKSYFMQDDFGQILDTHSISAGLDYPGVGPEHSYLHDLNRAEYVVANDDEVINAFQIVSKLEGIIPALESSHALAWVIKEAPKLSKEKVVVVNISGRGDKDIDTIAKKLGINLN